MTQRSPPLWRRPPKIRADDLSDRERASRVVLPGGAPPAPKGVATGMEATERAAEAKAPGSVENSPARTSSHPAARALPSPEIPELGAGEPLDASTLAQMQARFDADLSAVRLHTGTGAAQMAESFDAEAFAVGSHVVFGHTFDSTVDTDRQLLAHELAHVLERHDPHEPVARRQPKKQSLIQGLKPAYFQKVRKLLLTEPGIDSDTAELARKLDLTSTRPQKVKAVNAGGKPLEFHLSLKWMRKAGSSTQRAATSTSAAGADFEIVIGYNFGGAQPPSKHPYWSIKDPVDQRAWLLAEALHHELLHLQIEIDKIVAVSDSQATFSESFKQYVVTRSYLQEVQQPRFKYLGGEKVAATLKAIQDLVFKMCVDIPTNRRPSETQRVALLKRALGFFVQEKYAFWKTAATFGPAPDNPSIAHSYVRNLFAEILDPDPAMGARVYDNLETTRRRPNGFFGELASDLERQVEFLFGYLDTELLVPGTRHLK